MAAFDKSYFFDCIAFMHVGKSIERSKVCKKLEERGKVSWINNDELKELDNFGDLKNSATWRMVYKSPKQSQEILDEKKSLVEKIPAVKVLESPSVVKVEAEIVETLNIPASKNKNHLHESSIFYNFGTAKRAITRMKFSLPLTVVY